MTTLQQTIDRVLFDYLHLTHGARNALSGSMTDTVTTADFSYDLGGVAAGSRICVGLEDMHVWSASAQSATVERGDSGSAAAAHSQGDIVFVNPRFTAAQAKRAVNDELLALTSDGLYRTGALDLTSVSSIASYDMTGPPSGFIDILDVSIDYSGVVNDWPEVRLWELRRDADTDEFASGMALIVREDLESGRTLRVRYKKTFAVLAAADDDVEAVSGLWAEAHDLLAIGAAVRLMTGQEIPRSDLGWQGNTRRAQEVPPGAITQSYVGLRDLRNTRLAEEKRRVRMWDHPRKAVI